MRLQAHDMGPEGPLHVRSMFVIVIVVTDVLAACAGTRAWGGVLEVAAGVVATAAVG